MKLYLKTKDHSISGEEFDLIFDESKNMLLTKPIPDSLEEFYESDDYISHTDSNKTLVDRIYQKVKFVNIKNKVQLIENQIDNRNKLLDIGAGTGDFLHFAQKRGFQIAGVEPNHKARALAKQKEIVLKHGIEEIENESYDVITLWHVLEHLPNLPQQLKSISGILKDEGVLIVAVPNFRSWDAKHYKSYWAGYDVPRHLWHFSKESIRHLFGEHDMEVSKIKPMWFDAFYVSLLSEKYKGNRFYLISAFFKGFWSNLHALFTKEYSSLIYVLKKS